MAEQDCLDCWDTDPLDGAVSAAWMLVDWHQNCRVMACGGTVSFHVGEEMGRGTLCAGGVDVWLRENLYDAQTDAFLIPICDEAWFVLPHYYLSTGYLFLVRLPAFAGDSLALAESGALGSVKIYAGYPRFYARDRGFDPDEAMIWWTTALECLPRRVSGEERAEVGRLVRAVAGLNGVGVLRAFRHCEVATVQTSEEIAPGTQDIPMLAVMLLLIFSTLRERDVTQVTLGYEAIEEGLAIRLTVSHLGEEIRPEELPQLCACRELAQQNQQLFHCMTRRGVMRLMMCCVRKDYALIDVKTEPSIIPTKCV